MSYEEFNGFIEVLESIEKTVKNEAAVKFANDLRTLILTHGVIKRQNSGQTKNCMFLIFVRNLDSSC